MKAFVFGGTLLAALFTTAPAIAQTASPASLATPAPHARRSFFTSNQNRSEIAAHVEVLFNKLDLNRDGFISKDEIASNQSKFAERMAKSAPKRAARMFDRYDANHDGQITEAEAQAARTSASGKQRKSSRRASSLFARADANKDGIVTRAEFDSATANGKIKLRRANMRGSAIVRLFDIADSDRDGRVSLAEAQQAALRQFDAADTNHDGVLTPDERRQASKADRAKRRAAA
jgi:Ca2+-binding EF-hand superfamily protein